MAGSSYFNDGWRGGAEFAREQARLCSWVPTLGNIAARAQVAELTTQVQELEELVAIKGAFVAHFGEDAYCPLCGRPEEGASILRNVMERRDQAERLLTAAIRNACVGQPEGYAHHTHVARLLDVEDGAAVCEEYGFDAETGEPTWAEPTPAPDPSTPETGGGISSAPTSESEVRSEL